MPLVVVFERAGEPSAALEFVQQRVERSNVNAGLLVDFDAIDLPRTYTARALCAPISRQSRPRHRPEGTAAAGGRPYREAQGFQK